MRLRPCIVAGSLVAALAWGPEAYPYLASQTGVDSNLLVSDGRVIFIQADGTLTAIDLSTGDVLARKADLRYWGTLVDCPAGIALKSNEFTLLDRRSFDVIWRADPAYHPTIADGRVVAYDGNGLLTCRKLETGQALWTYNLPGALEYTVAAGSVMVYRSARFERNTEPVLVLLDLQTGRELFRKGPPPGTYFLAAHFDGKHIYLPAGPARGERSKVPFQRLVVWDLHGREVSAQPRPVQTTRLAPDAEDFTLGRLRFWHGEVSPVDAPDPVDVWHAERGSIFALGDYREQDVHLSGPTHQRPEGIVIGGGMGEFGLIDPRDAHIVWHTEAAGPVRLVGQKVVSQTREGRAECRDLASGKLLWTHSLPKAQPLVAKKHHVLHYRTPALGQPVLALLDLETGRELWRKKTLTGTRFQTAYFDGKRVYLAFGDAEGGQVSAPITRLVVWDTSGREVSVRDLPAGWDPFKAPVTLDGLVFDRDEVRPVGEKPEPEPPDCSLDAYQLRSGTLTIWQVGERPRHVSFDGPDSTWRGCLSYLGRNWIVEIAEADGKLLLGTDAGHVECIDTATGQSRWMYVFSADYQTVSFSSPHGLPPRLATQARRYRELNKRSAGLTGMVLLPVDGKFSLDGPPTCPSRGTRPATRVVYDPRPTDPYADVPKLVALSWFFAVLPPIMLLLLLCRTHAKPSTAASAAALGVVSLLLIVATFMLIGRAADSTCLALKLSIILTSALLLVLVARLYAQRRWLGATLVLGLLGVIGWYLWPALLYA